MSWEFRYFEANELPIPKLVGQYTIVTPFLILIAVSFHECAVDYRCNLNTKFYFRLHLPL